MMTVRCFPLKQQKLLLSVTEPNKYIGWGIKKIRCFLKSEYYFKTVEYWYTTLFPNYNFKIKCF